MPLGRGLDVALDKVMFATLQPSVRAHALAWQSHRGYGESSVWLLLCQLLEEDGIYWPGALVAAATADEQVVLAV